MKLVIALLIDGQTVLGFEQSFKSDEADLARETYDAALASGFGVLKEASQKRNGLQEAAVSEAVEGKC